MGDPLLSQSETNRADQDTNDGALPAFEFGIWPDVFGLVAVAGIMWFMFHFADGIL